MRAKSIIAILLLTTVAIPAFAEDGPPWQVRPYLSTYTDDSARSTTATWAWNHTALRHRFVCPYCGYSTNQPDPTPADNDYTCPNPFGLAAHPVVQLTEATPRQRAMGHLQVTAADIDGDTAAPLVGRPFHSGGIAAPIWNANPSPWEAPDLADQASWVTLRAANLSAGAPPLVQDGNGLRFLVVEPGSVRPAATARYIDNTETVTPAATFYNVAGSPGAAGPEQYIIHINPYKVSDGDVFYIRHSEQRNDLGETTGLQVEIYSTLYGNDFSMQGEYDPVVMGPLYQAGGGAVVISDSGALRVEVPQQFTGALAQSGTWVLKIVINSNTQTLPSPQELNYDSVDGADLYTPAEPDVLTNIAADLSQKKLAHVVYNSANTPALATADAGDGVLYEVAEKALNGNGGFTTTEIWPYRLPPEAAGRGRAILQWSELAAAGAPPLQQEVDAAGRPVFFREGYEWHFLADLSTPGAYDQRLITNGDVARLDAISLTSTDHTFLDSYFMCSRIDVDHDPASAHYLADDNWMDSLGNDRGPVVSDTEPATGGHARVVIGTLQDIGPPEAWGGEYSPDSRTPSRLFTLANRIPTRVLVCPVTDDGCGARYPDNAQYNAGDACPACGGTLVPARAEAQVYYDAQDTLSAAVGVQSYRMTPEALRFGPSGALIPIGAPDFVQEVLADIPAYQPPSVPPGSTPFSNDIANDMGYRGTMVAFNRPADEGDRWDTNTTWDAYYLSPETGRKFTSPEAIDAQANSQAQWVCSVCGAEYNRSVTDCLYCGHTFNTTDDLPTPRVPYTTLTAEEYDPFGVQVSVLREAALAADRRIVDLGWIAPGTPDDAPNTVNTPATIVPGSEGMPTDVSERSEMPLRNEGNITVDTEMRATPMLQTGVDAAVRSMARWGQTVPITLGTLFRYRPGPAEFDAADWLIGSPGATAAAGESATALLQAGIRSGAAVPYPSTTKPVPLGQPVGNYATELLLFVDLNGDGNLNFYDTQTGVVSNDYTRFDPGIDEPFEPVAPFATRARVVESRLPQSDFYSPDVTPTMLYQHNETAPDASNLQVLWVGQRAAPATAGSDAPAGLSPADVPPPTAPRNIFYSNAAVNDTAPAAADPFYRGWLWSPPADPPEEAAALSVSATPDENNTAPTAYVDETTDTRWVMWHRSQTSAAGMSSQLRFDSSTTPDWNGSDATEFIFGSSGAHSGLTGFVRPGVANAHWLLWHAGPTGREHLRYRYEWNPTSGTIPTDRRLMVSNSSTGQQIDFFEVGGQRYRKPALNPFTYVKQASAWGSTNAAGEFQMDVLYTGHVRALGNSDICWSRFNFGDPADPDFPLNSATDNFAKSPFPRVSGQLYGVAPFPSSDARGMPALRDANGDVRGYAGEQLESSPRRESFQARDLDWLLTYEYQSTLNGLAGPDWYDWLTAGADLVTYDDPIFYVGVVTDDGTGPRQLIYAVDWSRGSYDAATGLYTVLPRLIQLPTTDGGPLEELDPAARPAVWHPFDDSGTNAIYWRNIGGVMAKALLDPNLRQEAMDANAWDAGTPEEWPAVTLTINPASGMLQWSTRLFNPDNRWDSQAVFNEQNTPNIVDVVMYADYTPFIRRATTDRADDDSPSAFWSAGDSGRLTVFWRRSYGDTDTPHFGRPSFLHRAYTRAIQVGRPAINSITTVIDKTVDPAETATNVTFNLLSDANGVIEIAPDPTTSTARIGHRIEVTYVDANGITRTEQHRVIGWSLETPVPINAVTSEGPVRVIPEAYEVDPDGTANSGDEFDTVRYWLTWASPRGVYDMRPAASDGQRVHQSSDVYLAVVAPEHSSLIADLEVPRLEP